MPRPKKNPNERKTVEIKSLRIPMMKLLHKKDIRSAAKALEDFRLKMKEEEILLGATLTIRRDMYGYDYYLVATRLETDQELADRLEKERRAAEAKNRREAEKRAAEAEREAKRKQAEQLKAFEMIHKLAQENGLSVHDLVDKWTA